MNAPSEPSANLLGAIALIACGRHEGKTRSCKSCAHKAPSLFNIASRGTFDALASAICGLTSTACQDCRSKAAEIITETTGMPSTA
ncbi:hypothetical protein AB8O64_10995 [Streptomyces sp. QH1-20]|uniref:hypothetical protein n=1 Tax=Streptomyces sp. QH1-20 TaxID=3240934 RepID=UPI0035122137